MPEETKLTLTEKKARRFLFASLSAFALFSLSFLSLPYILHDVNAATRIDAEVDWGSVSLSFDPDVDATTAGDSAPGDLGHGDVNFGVLTPTTTSASNRGTMKVLKRTIGVETTGKYYTVYLSSIDNDTNLNLSTTVDGQPVTHTSINIPTIGDGETEGTFSSPSHFGAASGWGYAVPGASSTGIPEASSAFVVPQLVNQQINGATETAGASQTYNDTYWSGVAPRSNPQQIWKSETSDVEGFSNGDSFDMYYGIQVTDNTLAGSYSHQIVYTALASAAALDRVSSNIAHNREAGGRGDLVQLTVDLNDSLQTITSSMFRVALVPHSVMAQHIDGQNNYSVSGLTFSDYKSCPIASFQHGANNEYVNLSCVLPDAEEGEQFDFWVKINGYNIDYVSKDFSGNNLIASFIYAGLQTKYPSSDARSGTFAVQEMQEMTEGVCSLTNAWGTGTGTDARVYNYTGTGETLGVAQTDTDMLMNIGTFALTDNRDNKEYLVRRLADGNCWMVQNLDLDLASFAGTNNLTWQNTDLNSKDTWDPSASALAIAKTYDPTVTQENYFETFSLNYLGNAQQVQFQPQGIRGTIDGVTYYWGTTLDGPGGQDTGTVNSSSDLAKFPRSYDPGLLYVPAPRANLALDSVFDINHASQYTGQFYNVIAATAESFNQTDPGSNASDSICPMGWSLPLSLDDDEPGISRSYSRLFNQYIERTSDLTFSEFSASFTTVPMSFALSEYYNTVNGRGATVGTMANSTYLATSLIRSSTSGTRVMLAGGSMNEDDARIYSGPAFHTSSTSIRCVARGTQLPDDYEPEEETPACGPGKICYDGNLATSGEMDDQTAASNTSVMLTAPLYKKDGYAFAGWSTEENGFGTIYGPNQILTTPDLSSEGLQLYAKWVPSVGTFQTWTGCSAMDTDQVIGLTDSRDGKTYSVAKLKDGNCWMTQNLNLDLADFAGKKAGDSGALTPANTDINTPGKTYWDPTESTETKINTTYASELASRNLTSDFTGLSTLLLGQAQSTQFHDSSETYRWGSNVSDDGNFTSLNTLLTNNNAVIPRQFSDGTERGLMYNWYAAIAESVGFETSANVVAADSICPAGWKLPTDYADLFGAEFDIRTNVNESSSPELVENGVQVALSYPMSYTPTGDLYWRTGGVLYDRQLSALWASSTRQPDDFGNPQAKASGVRAFPAAGHEYREITPIGYAPTTYGYSIRCVQR